MKPLIQVVFKYIGASIGVLVGAYTLGWSGAITLHNLFKTDRVEAMHFVENKILESEAKLMAIRSADLDGIHGKMDVIIRQNENLLGQIQKTQRIFKEVK